MFEFLDASVEWLNNATGVEFSIHGWIAFVLGGLGVLALNVGLMWLVVQSNRKGHDEQADDAGRILDPPNTVRR